MSVDDSMACLAFCPNACEKQGSIWGRKDRSCSEGMQEGRAPRRRKPASSWTARAVGEERFDELQRVRAAVST